MKKNILAIILVLSLISIPRVIHAQSANTVRLENQTTAIEPGDKFTVVLNAAISEPIVAFSFQVEYDPACAKTLNQTSGPFLPDATYLPATQHDGLVDATFTTLPVSQSTIGTGTLAEMEFQALSECNTSLALIGIRMIASADEASIHDLEVDIQTPALQLYIALPPDPVVATATSQPVTPTPTQEVVSDSTPVPASTGQPGTIQPLVPVPSDWIMVLLLAILGSTALFAGLILLRLQRWPKGRSAPIEWHGNPSLYIKSDSTPGQTIPLTKLPAHIGRGEPNDVDLSTRHVSRQHAEIFQNHTGYYVVDLGSKNGTFVNGKCIHNKSILLRNGDKLKFGRDVLAVFRVQVDMELTL